MLYSLQMMDHKDWSKWAFTLQEKRLAGLAAVILEGCSPLRVFIAQTMMGFLPLFGQYQGSSWMSFAQMLEDPAECRSFTATLLKEKNQ